MWAVSNSSGVRTSSTRGGVAELSRSLRYWESMVADAVMSRSSRQKRYR